MRRKNRQDYPVKAYAAGHIARLAMAVDMVWQWGYNDTKKRYYPTMKKKHQRILALIYSRPVSGSIKWSDIEALFLELGADLQEREGSRIAVILFGQVRIFHRPHPSPDTDKGAVASIRKWLDENGVRP